MDRKERRYPIGIQTFSEIIEGKYVYVDKTDLMWKLQRLSKFIFLSRPRRFGKSLLSSTFHSFFAGERHLFEGLKVMQYEREWEEYPVFHFDLSATKHLPIQGVKEELNRQLRLLEKEYGSDEQESSPGMRLAGLIIRAKEKTGKKVVVIVDEYDAPLLDVLHTEDLLHETRELMQEFYQRLKMYEPFLRFCFITGITKFSQLSIFSTINNLTNVSLDPSFSAICGITEEELTTNMSEDISMLANEYKCDYSEMLTKLRNTYDGYRFSRKLPHVYNPFSIMKAFNHKFLDNYWFESGTPSFLFHQLHRFHTDITQIDNHVVPSSAFDQPTENMVDALPLLYQSGYLTIKDYDREADIYTLSIPNKEVRVGLTEGLLPNYIGLKGADVQTGFALRFWRALKQKDIDLALREMKSYLESLPYVEGFKKKLEEVSTAEGFYEWTFYLIFSMLNVYVQTLVKCIRGRIDMVAYMPDTIYVMELKLRGTAQEALEQINSKGYALPYASDGRKIIKVGIHFDIDKKSLDDWIISE